MSEKKYKIDQVAIRMVREKPLYSSEPIDSPEKAVKLLADAIRELLAGNAYEVILIGA